MRALDYNLKSLQKIKVKGREFPMFITPRYIDHYVKNDYEKFTADLILRYTKPGSTFVDIGAHYGFFSILVAKNIKNSRVIAIEPVEENFKIFKKNIKLNKLKNVKPHQLAISDRVGEKEFNITEASDSAGFYKHPQTPTIKKIKVKTTTLDELLKNQKIDLVKVDTEGHEIPVLDGMKKILKKNKDVKLIVEFNPKCQKSAEYEPEQLLKKIDELGFEMFLIKDDEREIYRLTDQVDNWDKLMNEASYKNLFCIPKKKALYATFFSHSANLGGAELSLIELIDELQDKDVLVNTILPQPGDVKTRLDQNAVCTNVVPYNWWAKNKNLSKEEIINQNAVSYENIMNFLPKLELLNPHIIYTNTVSIPWGAISAAFLSKPHVWHIHEFGKKDHNLFFDIPQEDIHKLINLTSNHVIVNSKAVHSHYADFVNNDKTTLVYYYIDLLDPAKLKIKGNSLFQKEKSLKLLNLANIHPKKGQRDAVLAVQILLKQGYNVEFVTAGMITDRKYYEDLTKFVKNNKLEHSIHIHDFIKNPFPLLKLADIVLTCSANEAFGRATAEAMFFKKPVIGTRSGGTVELIKEGFNGLLYKPGDHKELTKKIEFFIKNKKKIKQYGQKGYDFISETISKENYGGKIYEIINRVKNEEPPISKLDPISVSLSRAIVVFLKEKRKLQRTVEEPQKSNLEKQKAIEEIEKDRLVLRRKLEKLEKII